MISNQHLRNPLHFGLLCLALSLPLQASQATIVDTFDDGYATWNLPAEGGTMKADQTGLSTGSVAGGTRHIEFSTTQPGMGMAIHDGVVDMTFPKYGGEFYLMYDGNNTTGLTGNLNLDLAGMDGFELTFDTVPKNLVGYVFIRDSGYNNAQSQLIIPSAGTYEVPIVSFFEHETINWSDVDYVHLRLYGGSVGYSGSPYTVTVSEFKVIPEPHAFGLLPFLGLAVLLRRKAGTSRTG